MDPNIKPEENNLPQPPLPPVFEPPAAVAANIPEPSYGEESPHKHVSRMILVTIGVIVLASIIGFFVLRRSSSNVAKKPSVPTNPAQTIPADDNLELKKQQAEEQAKISPTVPEPTAPKEPIIPKTTSDIADAQQPWLQIGMEEKKNEFTVGEEIHFIISGFSQTKDIHGYDLILAYDPELIDVISLESLAPSFEIKQIQKKSHLTITGFKRLDVTSATPLANDQLLRVTAVSKKAGQGVVSILSEVGKERTKLVDSQVQVIIPQVQGIQLAIQ